MLSQEAALLKKIAESRESIRKKHLQLKHGLQDIQTNVSRVFQPIIKPIHELANNQRRIKVEKKLYSSTPHKNQLNVKLFDENETVDQESDIFETPVETEEIDNLTENALVDVEKYLKIMGNYGSDSEFGVRRAYGKRMIGNKEINFMDGKVIVGDQKYPVSDGLLELLFKKNVDRNVLKDADIAHYKKIAQDTNLLRKKFKPDGSFKNPSYNKKFDAFLWELNPSNTLDKTGKGLPKFMIARRDESPLDYRYWDDPNELVDRLRLLVAERSAGNDNHDNEIQAIIEELREAKIIL